MFKFRHFILIPLICWISSTVSGQVSEDSLYVMFGEAGRHLELENRDKAEELLKEIGTIAERQGMNVLHLYALLYRSLNYKDAGDYKRMATLLREARMASGRYEIAKDNPVLFDFNFLTGLSQYEQADYESALFYYRAALDAYLQDSVRGSYFIEDVYNNIGLCFFKIGDYEKAFEYYSKSIRENRLSKRKINDAVEAQRLKNMADACQGVGRFDQAGKLFRNSGIILKDLPEGEKKKKQTANYYDDLAEYYIEVEQYDSAHFVLEYVLANTSDTLLLINYYQNKGRAFIGKQQYEKADEELEKAFGLCRGYFTGKHDELGETHYYAGVSARRADKLSVSLEHFQAAIIASSVGFDNESPEQHPAESQIRPREVLLNSFLAKAEVFSDLGNYTASLSTYKRVQDFIRLLLSRHVLNDESRFYWMRRSKSIYEAAIQTALLAGDKEQAFLFSQSSHGFLLWQDFMKEESMRASVLPKVFIQEEKNIKLDLNHRRHSMFLAVEEGDKKRVSKLEEEIFELEYDLEQLNKKMEENHPTVFALKYEDGRMPGVQAIKDEILDGKSALVEYFLGEDMLYIFLLTHDDIQVFQQSISTDFIDDIMDFQQCVSRVRPDDYPVFTRTAVSLYQTLFSDVEKVLDVGGFNRVLIIPDEEIHLVPFSALIANVPQNAINTMRYDLLPFLVYKYDLSYNYSSTLYTISNDRKGRDELVSFAPSFEQNASGESLDSLLFNMDEVLVIQEIVGGRVRLDTSATTGRFKDDIQKYRIAHLASHAECNDTMPGVSKIYFSDGAVNAGEIYSLPSSLDLAVLSACETGRGKIRKGEGVISLARAFMSSGCSSIVTSLWKVKDKQTSKIMKDFYIQLSQSASKDKSLNEAQRQYLKTSVSSSYYHPYYWAAFIQIGNREPVFKQGYGSGQRILLLVLGVGVILLLLYVFLRNILEIKWFAIF